MKKPPIHVALLFGGRSAEHRVSIVSARSIHRHLDPEQYSISCIYINRKGKWRTVDSPEMTEKELNKGPFFSFLPWDSERREDFFSADIYFPVLHGPYGEDGTVQGLLELADVPYVGSGVLSSAGCMDKDTAKVLFRTDGLPVVDHLPVREEEWRKDRQGVLRRTEDSLIPPLFVKPANLGSSVGISKVRHWDELPSAVESAFRFDEKILIEQGVAGRELECSVLGNDDPEASLPGEIIPFREFYDYRDKYLDGKTAFRIPAELPPEQTKAVQAIAVRAFRLLGCSGMARVDFFLEAKTERLFLSEINTIPGFTDISMYPKLWAAGGLPYTELLNRLIELGLERHSRKKRVADWTPS